MAKYVEKLIEVEAEQFPKQDREKLKPDSRWNELLISVDQQGAHVVFENKVVRETDWIVKTPGGNSVLSNEVFVQIYEKKGK